MAELKFLKGQAFNFEGLSKNPDFFYVVSNTDGSIDLYLGDKLIAKGAMSSDIKALEDAIAILNGEESVNGSVKHTVAEEVAKVVADAPEDFDTLKEIADYIAADKTGAAEMLNKISDLTLRVGTAESEIDTLQSEMEAVEAKAHEHVNKDVLDGISSDKIANWDAAEQNAKNYADGNFQEKGDYALKSELPTVPSLDGYATQVWVNEQGFLTEHQSLAGYATEAWVNEQGFLTEHQSLAEYAKKSELPTKTSDLVNDSNFLTEHQSLAEYAKKSELPSVEGLASESWVNGQGFLKAIPSEYVDETELSNTLVSYALKSELPTVPTKVSELQNDANYITLAEVPAAPSLDGYATKEWVGQQGFLTEHQDITDLAKQADLDAEIAQRKALVGEGNIQVTLEENGTQKIGLVWGEF